MLELTLPDRRYLESVQNAVGEYKNFPSPFDINCVQKLVKAAENDFKTYFQEVEKARNGVDLPEGHVPSTTLWLLDGNRYAGSFDIRHYLNDSLRQTGGHIAYQIIPSLRRKGFAKDGLKLALNYCKNSLKIEKALLTCRFENEASYRAMRAVMAEYGGYEDTPAGASGQKERRVWIMTAAPKQNC